MTEKLVNLIFAAIFCVAGAWVISFGVLLWYIGKLEARVDELELKEEKED